MEKIITYFGQQVKVACDGKCSKAWGINNRPRIEFSKEDLDDMVFLSDDEIKENAPENPGTYEGGCAKPIDDDEKPNKWCVRECERCAMEEDGKLELPDFTKRQYNQPSKHIE
jgi:hypothetical protein